MAEPWDVRVLEDLLTTLADHIRAPVLIHEVRRDAPSEHRIVFVNDAAVDVLGYARDDLLGRKMRDLVITGRDCRDKALDRMIQSLRAARPGREQFLVRHGDGRDLWVEAMVTPHDGGAPDSTFEIILLHDLSHLSDVTKSLSDNVTTMEREIDALQQEATALDTRLTEAVDCLPFPVMLFDAEERLVAYNEALARVWLDGTGDLTVGARFEDILKSSLGKRHLKDVEVADATEWLKERLDRFRDPGDAFEIELRDGRIMRVLERRTASGEFVSCRFDVTELRTGQKELAEKAAELERLMKASSHQARHDALTGLPNRRYLDEHLRELSKSLGDGDSVGLLNIDLDNFKQINDTCGHAAGDEALRQASARLKALTREDDLLFRVGGDEFALVVKCPADRSVLVALADRAVSGLRDPMIIDGYPHRSGGSVGVSLQYGPDIDPEDLMMTADLALYEAKRKGRGQVQSFTVDLKRRMRSTRRLTQDILAGLETGAFYPVYQPQVNARTRAITGAEVLCRWRHDTRGTLTPADFLDQARDLGVVGDIDRQIYARVTEDLERFHRYGHRLPRISFNTELDRLLDDGLSAELRRVAARGPAVAVELLESLSLEDPDAPTTTAIESLRRSGIAIEIDDFGSCRASLLGVLNIMPDVLKIDRDLVAPIMDERARRDVIRALVNLANTLDIRVTAEGVESEAQADLLSSLGCHTLQGYAIARPMTLDAFDAYLKSSHLAEPIPFHRARPPRESDEALLTRDAG